MWYDSGMRGTFTVTMGDRGRLVIPAELRRDGRFTPGTTLVLVDTPSGVVLFTRDQLKAQVRSDLDGLNLVDELMDQRRRAADQEDAA